MAIDMRTNYGGLHLVSPIVVGACPLTMEEQARVAFQTAGAGAIVLPSLFEEHVIRWSAATGRSLTPREQELLAMTDHKHADASGMNADTYLAAVNRASGQLSIPVIASLNGYVVDGWVDFAGELQAAGADAIELNIHHPLPSDQCGPREMEEAVVELARQINGAITIPLFVKLGRYYTSIPHLARQLLSGVQGMVLFGRSPDTDICLDTMKLNSSWGLTVGGSITHSLTQIMRSHAFCPAMPLAASGGIASPPDAIKTLLAGADVAMVTSAIYREGASIIRILNDGLREFMERNHLISMRDLQLKRPLEFANDEDRAAYIAALTARLETAPTSHTRSIRHPGQLID